MAYTTYFNLSKPEFKTLRYDVPTNENWDLVDGGFTCWADANEPGNVASAYPDATLTEGTLWRDLTNHILKTRGAAAWEEVHTDSRKSILKNVTSPDAPAADTSLIYGYDAAAGISCPHVRTEDNKTIKLYQQATIADIDATAITALTNAFGTADGTLEDITDTTATDQSGAIENNFKECTTEIATLKTVVDDMRTKFNTLLSRFETNGFLASA